MTELVFMVEEAPEGGYTARALGKSIYTEADDLDSLRSAISDAVNCHFDPGTEQSRISFTLHTNTDYKTEWSEHDLEDFARSGRNLIESYLSAEETP